MMADAGEFDAGGGPVRHIPVLLDEVLSAVRPRPGMRIIDGTFGAGGYARAFLQAGASVLGIDRDPDAIAAGASMVAASDGRLELAHGPFSELDHYAGGLVDAVVLDIGVSSMQIDEGERGFSFRHDGPLDMRMAQAGPSAADVVNSFKVGDLTRIFGLLGEERHAGRIARMIERRRETRPFERTLELADAIELTVGRNPKDRIHPATRVFQALRIFVNDELGQLAQALLASERALKPGGRLAVVTFHSLEDRIVKTFLAERSGRTGGGSRHLPQVSVVAPVFERPDAVIAASAAEAGLNPRARSAKLRAATRTAAPARNGSLVDFGLPKLPDIHSTSER
jgi:16S rRNA (cytosine1402-N4)-methyltransferase